MNWLTRAPSRSGTPHRGTACQPHVSCTVRLHHPKRWSRRLIWVVSGTAEASSRWSSLYSQLGWESSFRWQPSQKPALSRARTWPGLSCSEIALKWRQWHPTVLCSCCLPWSSGWSYSLQRSLAQVLRGGHKEMLWDFYLNEHVSLALPLLMELFHFHKSLNIHWARGEDWLRSLAVRAFILNGRDQALHPSPSK